MDTITTMGQIFIQHINTYVIRNDQFYVVYGRPPHIIPYDSHTSTTEVVDTKLQERDKILTFFRRNLLQTKNIRKQIAYKKRKDTNFNIGDLLLEKL